MTPGELAAELGISPKTLRQWLRDIGARPPSERGQRWTLDDALVTRARQRFGGSGSRPAVARSRPSPPPNVDVPAATVSDVIDTLLHSPVLAPTELRPPAIAGIYAWWVRNTSFPFGSPEVSRRHPDGAPPEWSLLYVGIAPSGPASARTLAGRLLGDHCRGNIGGSTFRQSMGALLMTDLALVPRAGSDRSRLADEKPLTEWLEKNCGATFAVHPSPWLIEEEVIRELCPPLNLRGAVHPFAVHVSRARSELRIACRPRGIAQSS